MISCFYIFLQYFRIVSKVKFRNLNRKLYYFYNPNVKNFFGVFPFNDDLMYCSNAYLILIKYIDFVCIYPLTIDYVNRYGFIIVN